jgi:hypothetical protein
LRPQDVLCELCDSFAFFAAKVFLTAKFAKNSDKGQSKDSPSPSNGAATQNNNNLPRIRSILYNWKFYKSWWETVVAEAVDGGFL